MFVKGKSIPHFYKAGYNGETFMSSFYNPYKTRGLFDPRSKEPHRISRSKIDLFLECPRCFYMDQRLGVGRPPGFPFSLNAAVDGLLKKEFDFHRAKKTAHPLMKAYGLNDVVPFDHPDMEKWRDSLRRGVEFLHEETNLSVRGGVDDVWVNNKEELHVVDYKATAKASEVNIDAEWQIGYKRQMETYQWLLRKNGFTVSPTGYFVYVNGKLDAEAFDGKLEFDVRLIPYEGDAGWLEPTLVKIKTCLMEEKIPAMDPECDYCRYRKASAEKAQENSKKLKK